MKAEVLVKLAVNYQDGTGYYRRGEIIIMPRLQAQGVLARGHGEEVPHPALANAMIVKMHVGLESPTTSLKPGGKLVVPRAEGERLIAAGMAEKAGLER